MIALFALILLLAGNPSTGKTLIGITPLFGLDPKLGEDARITGPLSALWYFIFILPMFFFTPDVKSTGVSMAKAVKDGLVELKVSLGELMRTRRHLARFLIGRMIYQDGVNALIVLGGALAPACSAGRRSKSAFTGSSSTLSPSPAMSSPAGSTASSAPSVSWCSASSACFSQPSGSSRRQGLDAVRSHCPINRRFRRPLWHRCREVFIFYGLFIGIAFGPVQASSRSFMSRSIKPEEAGRYFGIYALSGRATSFMATLAFSVTPPPPFGPSRHGDDHCLPCGRLAFLLATPYPAGIETAGVEKLSQSIFARQIAEAQSL